MSKKVKILIAIILIILVIVAVVVLGKNSKEVSEETNSNTLVQNTENDENSTEVENVVSDNEDYSNIINEIPMEQQLETRNEENNVYEEDSNVGSTDKKQEAINLVKQTWGEDDTVTFSCDSVTSDGKYVIAVSSKTEARVLNYYKVDLTKKTVEVDY
jgi:FtsZ-interacting cell division protein ZipA